MKTGLYLLVLLATMTFSTVVAADFSGEKEKSKSVAAKLMTVSGLPEEPIMDEALLVDPPVITNPLLTMFFPDQNMYQFTHIWEGGATYDFWVAAGSATLQRNLGDCYITTATGASVCVAGTNSAGTGTPYCFYVPGM